MNVVWNRNCILYIYYYFVGGTFQHKLFSNWELLEYKLEELADIYHAHQMIYIIYSIIRKYRFPNFFCRLVLYNINLTCCLYSLTTKLSTEEFYFWMSSNETYTLITSYNISFNKFCLLSVGIKTRIFKYNFYVYYKTWVYSSCTILTLACGIC